MNKQPIARLCGFILPVLLASSLSAEVPDLINYQGRLTDQQGAPVTGNRTITVRIYDAPSGGNMTYEENIGTVMVSNGTYSFQFGDEGNGVIGVLAGANNYLAISVNSTEESSRTRLLTVPYALRARESEKSADTQSLAAQIESISSNITDLQNKSAEFNSNLSASQNQTTALSQSLALLLARFRVLEVSGNFIFDNTPLNYSVERNFVIRNSGFDRLTISGITYPSGFNGTSWSGILPAGGYQNLTVTFTPSGIQTYSGNISISSDATSGSSKIFVTGNGAEDLVSTLAGSGNASFMDGTSTEAAFNYPTGIVVDSEGNTFIADNHNHRIRKVTPNGDVSTFAGSGNPGFADGNGLQARFNYPVGLAIDSNGNLYVADSISERIRKINPQGIVTTLAGSGANGFNDGDGTNAIFRTPAAIALDPSGNVYVADFNNHRIRKITPSGSVSTLAGSGFSGYIDGNGTSARFNAPHGVAVDSTGNVYVSDYLNHLIRKISPTGSVSTVAGAGIPGFADGDGVLARFSYPTQICLDLQGNVIVADSGNHRIRKVTPSGKVTTLAGGSESGFADGLGSEARFLHPQGVAIDEAGNIFVTDHNHRIRKIIPPQAN